MSKAADLESQLAQLAQNMIKAAEGDGVSVSEKLKVFEAVSNHYVNMQKVKGKIAPSGKDNDGGTMAGMRDRINNGGSGEDDEQA